MILLNNNIEKISFTIFIFVGMLLLSITLDDVDAQSKKKSKKDINPILTDPDLKAELIIDKLKFPIGMEIIGNDDFLLIEKNTGVVKRIAGNQVKQIEAQEEHLGLTMDQMPAKGEEITNKPNIKQEHIKEIRQEALENAEKA